MKTFGTVFYYIFITIIMVFTLFLVASLFPITGNYKVKIVLSGSMDPELPIGSLVFIKPEDKYFVGDIITFGKDTKTAVPTTHRIVLVRDEPTGQIFHTKGDFNDTEDSKETSKSEIIGRVFFDIPYVGYVLDFAKKPVGFILLIIIPALAIILDEIGNIWREAKKIRSARKGGLT